MKQLKGFQYLLVLLIIVAMLCPTIVLASDVSEALWHGDITITNSGNTSTSSVSTNLTLDSPSFTSAGYANATLSDIAIQINGEDTAFMPGYDTNPWIIFAPDIGAGQNLSYDLYSSGATGGKQRYFPGSSGMTTTDFEVGDNFTIVQDGWIDTTAVGGSLASKDGAYDALISASGNVSTQIIGNENTSDNNTGEIYGTGWEAQTFTTGLAQPLEKVRLQGYREGNPGNLTISIKATTASKPSGADLVSATFDADALTTDTSGEDLYVDIPYKSLSAATMYSVVVRALGGDADNSFWWRLQGSDSMANGSRCYSSDNGSSWATQASDFNFRTIQASVTATGVSSAEYSVNVTAGDPQSAPGNVLHWAATAATSSVNCTALFDSATDITLTFDTKFDNAGSAGNPIPSIFDKRVGGEILTLYVANSDGALFFQRQGTGAGGVKALDAEGATKLSWDADTWYHVTVSSSSSTGMRIKINEWPTQTGTDNITWPASGSFIIGNYEPGAADRFKGYIANFATYDRVLSAAEEIQCARHYYPTDYTELWYFDEGSGTSIPSYGSTGTTATAGANTDWQSGVTRPVDFAIYIDDVAQNGTNLKGNAVPDNSNDWTFAQNTAMPYLERHRIWVNHSLVQDISWEYGSTFTDASGQGNDATPTFRTTSSDANVSAVLSTFSPVSQAQLDTFSLTTELEILTSEPSAPTQMYEELDVTSIPGGEAANVMLEEGDIPQAAWWYPLLFFGICIIGLLTYGATTMHRGLAQKIREGQIDGSLLTMFIVMEVLLAVFGIIGIIPFWPALLFPIAGISLVMSRKHFSWG